MHRILATGAAAVAALAFAGSASAWSWPADGAVLRPFALGADAYAGGQHRGIDVAGPNGSAVRAPAAGLVTFAGTLPTHGRGVTILTADGYSVTLVHLGSIEVAKGASVGEGETVGTMGISGTPEQDEPSVHLGIRHASDEEGYVDPLGLLPPRTAPAPAPSPAPEPVAAPALAPAPVAVHPPAPPSPTPVSSPVPTPPPTTVTATASPSPATPSTASAGNPAGTSPEAAAPSATAPAQQGADEAGITIAGSTASVVRTATANAPRPESVGRPVASRVDTPAARPAATSTHGAAASTSTAAVSAPQADPVATPGAHVVHRAARGPETDRSRTHTASRVSAAPGDVNVPPSEAVPRERPVPERPAAYAIVRDGPALVRDATRGVPTPRQAAQARHAPQFAVGWLGVRELAAGIALLALLAAAVGRQVARRIGMDGALLRHHADLLRQLDAAHRPRLHDRGRRRVRAPSAAART